MGTQQADRPAHQGGPIARLKMFLRHNYMKQWFANLRDPKVPNRVDIAEMVKLVDLSWRESFQPEKMSRLNAEVGYYIDDEGYLQWDITRLLLKDESAPVPPLGAVPEEAARAPGPAPAPAPLVSTPAEFGAPPAIPDADAIMPLTTSRFGGREAQQRAMAETVTKAARMRAEVTALQSAIGLAQAPVVDRPTHKIRRGQSARQHTRDGMVVGSDDWKRRVDKEEASQPSAKRARTMDSFWSNHRAEVLGAEAALLAAGGNVADVRKVGDLKGLILLRTGKVPKAKNNAGGAILDEAQAAVEAQDRTLMPDAPAESAPSSDDEVIFTCDSCCKELTQASDIVHEGDMLFCPCGERRDSDD